jgi:hypothetical protein
MERVRRYRYSLDKHPHYEVRCTRKKKRPGQKIKGWWIYDGPEDTFTTPDPPLMNEFGWCQVILCIFLCYPCACLPCFLSANYDGHQIPDFDGRPIPDVGNQTENYPAVPYAPEMSSSSYSIPVAVPVMEENNK